MTNKLGIIGGSGLYDIEEFKDKEELDINTPWGKPSDKILKINLKDSVSPVLIEDASDKNSYYVIMPMKI